jgi:hypothetical protein
VADVMLEHGRALAAFFGEAHAMRQMRKWVGWYTKGFRGSAAVRAGLDRLHALADLERIAASLDRSEPFPAAALRVSRAKGSRTQRVTLPEGWLEARDDDTPVPDCGEDLESALQAG